MTPRLLPHHSLRHVYPALLSGALGLCAWWAALVGLDAWRDRGNLPSVDTEGAVMLALVAGAVAAGQPLLEGRFRRTGMGGRVLAALLAGLLAVGAAALGGWLHTLLADRVGGAPPGTLALRWRLGPWMVAGAAAAWGPWCVRVGRQLIEVACARWRWTFLPAAPPLEGGWVVQTLAHGVAGLAAGLTGGLGWYLSGLALGDRFFAAAGGAWLVGAAVGGLTWAVPERHFVGWMRVRAGARPGWRVHLDPRDPARSERFVGHFARGMDVFLPEAEGVAELHVSLLAPGDGVWTARGLSQRRVTVNRALERVELAYDPALPAPLETPLRTDDLVRVGDDVELELVVGTEDGVP